MIHLTDAQKRKLGLACLIASLIFFGLDISLDLIFYLGFGEPHVGMPVAHLMFETLAFFSLLYAIRLQQVHQQLIKERKVEAENKASIYESGTDYLLVQRFEELNLTEAEREIAIFIMKGMSPGEIAELRGTVVGTVKTQTTSVFKKMQVKSRAELLSQLIHDVMDLDKLQLYIKSRNSSINKPKVRTSV
jgi:DNA-binding CsgD family transcriptional regulator